MHSLMFAISFHSHYNAYRPTIYLQLRRCHTLANQCLILKIVLLAQQPYLSNSISMYVYRLCMHACPQTLLLDAKQPGWFQWNFEVGPSWTLAVVHLGQLACRPLRCPKLPSNRRKNLKNGDCVPNRRLPQVWQNDLNVGRVTGVTNIFPTVLCRVIQYISPL